MTALVALEAVRKEHRTGAGVVVALAGIDLAVAAGEVVALLGPSGSGKSSVLQLLCGWEAPDAGAIIWSPEVAPADRWHRLAIVPQGLGLLDELTVRENVELPARLGSPVHDVEEVLERLGLDHLAVREPSATSLGEQQRVAVARAVVARPVLLLADEPTSNQDAASAARVLDELSRLAAGGTGCLVATHSREAADRADRVVELRDGRVLDAG